MLDNMGSGYLNDLYELNTTDFLCTNLSASTQGSAPTPRYGHGFAYLNQGLYVFGGYDFNGISTFQLYAFTIFLIFNEQNRT